MKEDYAEKRTDWKLRKLEKRIHGIYDEALQEMAEKLTDHLDKYEKQRSRKAKNVDDGTLDVLEYTDWLKREAYKEKHHRQMIEVLCEDTYNTNDIAAQMISGHMLEVYALNANYAAYDIATNTEYRFSFSMYDKDVVERLLRDDPDLLPGMDRHKKKSTYVKLAKVDKKKDFAWNRKKIQNELTQGILQGESVYKIAKRFEKVVGMNKKTAITNARTATTSAQNAGRMNSFFRAEDMGIDVKKSWMATIDGSTRHSHRLLDGQERPLEEPFDSEHGNIMYPGDPYADPAEVYNCRCRLRGITKYSRYDASDMSRRFVRPPEGKTYKTYEEWKYEMGGKGYEQY